MQPIYLSKQLAAASSNNVATVSSGATSATANTSNMPLDTQRRLLLTSSADNSSITFTITGTREGGGIISESLLGSTGGSSVVGTGSQTKNDFLTVTKITASSAATSAVAVGTNSVASTRWVPTNWHVSPINIGAALTITASSGITGVNWEYTYDDPSGVGTPNAASYPYPNPNLSFPTVWVSTMISTASVNTQGNILTPVAATRLTLTSTSSASIANLTILQAGLAK